MALSNDEKTLLRMAIADGFFTDRPVNSSNGTPTPRPLTADLLKSINDLSDGDMRNKLILYKATKSSKLDEMITRQTDSLNALKGMKTTLSKIVVAQPVAAEAKAKK